MVRSRQFGILLRRAGGRFQQDQVAAIGPDDQAVIGSDQAGRGEAELAGPPDELARGIIQAGHPLPHQVQAALVQYGRAGISGVGGLPDLPGARP